MIEEIMERYFQDGFPTKDEIKHSTFRRMKFCKAMNEILKEYSGGYIMIFDVFMVAIHYNLDVKMELM